MTLAPCYWDELCADMVTQLLFLLSARSCSASGNCANLCARVVQAGAATRAGCSYRSGAVGCRDMHSCHSSCAVLCRDSPISECTAAAGCRLRWLLPNRVQRPVQDQWQGETCLRFKLRGLSAPCAHSAVQGRASDARGCRFRLQRECAADVRTFEPRRVPIAVEVHDVVALLG